MLNLVIMPSMAQNQSRFNLGEYAKLLLSKTSRKRYRSQSRNKQRPARS